MGQAGELGAEVRDRAQWLTTHGSSLEHEGERLAREERNSSRRGERLIAKREDLDAGGVSLEGE